MYRILTKRELSPGVVLMVVEAPLVAKSARAGQFIILRVDEAGERIPLTVADYDRDRGTVTIVFLVVGTSTTKLAELREGDAVADFIGPLGHPTHVEKYGTVVMIGGGLGIAPIYPIARAMREAGNRVISIIGARTEGLLFYVDEMRSVSDELLICTDDGSAGFKGFGIQRLDAAMREGLRPDLVVAIGPVVMMRAVCEFTRAAGLKTVVSLNPVMVDGTGMCGACRVTVGGATRFVCVDGPDFDGHAVDFEELVKRQRYFLDEERRSKTICESRLHPGECEKRG
jgi:ferredoxin--NADP+ reductase